METLPEDADFPEAPELIIDVPPPPITYYCCEDGFVIQNEIGETVCLADEPRPPSEWQLHLRRTKQIEPDAIVV
jgi:hypothetical protein